MRTRSARWDTAIANSHRLATTASILLDGETVAEDLAVLSGSVIVNRYAQTRSRLEIVLAEPLLLPIDATDPLSPFGFEIAVSRGITYPDGTTETMPLGVFPIQQSSVNGRTLASRLFAYDRSQRVRDARLEDDTEIPAGYNYATGILVVVGSTGDYEYAYTSTTYTTPAFTVPAQSDLWDLVTRAAASIGCEIYFDGAGVNVLRPEPTLAGDPVWTIAEGAAGLLVDAAVDLDRGPAYNRVIVTGENATLGTVPRGVATDDNPTSPTYYFGAFGRKPRFYYSPFVTDDDQAATAAAALLASGLGVARSLTLSAIPNPALEAGDVIQVTRADLGLDGTYLVDAITTGLGPNAPQQVQVRSQQVTA